MGVSLFPAAFAAMAPQGPLGFCSINIPSPSSPSQQIFGFGGLKLTQLISAGTKMLQVACYPRLCSTQTSSRVARPPSAPTHPAQKIERTDETASAAVSSSPHSFSLPVHQRFRLISRPPGHKGCFRRTFLFAFLRFRLPKNVRNQFATTATKPPPNAVQPRGMRRMGSEAKWKLLTPIRKISERRQHREGQIQPSPRIDGIGIGIGKIHGSSTIINRQTR